MPATYVILTLILGNFAIGTGAIMMAGLVPLISQDLQISVAQTGQLMTAFGIACGVGAPILVGLTAKIDRKKVAVCALLYYGIMHLIAVWVNDYLGLLVLRFLTAFAAAIFTAIAANLAAASVPPEQRNKAIGQVFMGWSIASVIGLPAASYIGAHWHWHHTMLAQALVCFVAAALSFWVLPGGVVGQKVGREAWQTLFANKALMQGVAVTVLNSVGLFVMFAYLAVLYRDYVQVSAAQTSLLFAVYGVFGVLGAAWAARSLVQRSPRNVVNICLINTMVVLIIWPASQWGIVLAALIAAAWGISGFATNGTQQARLGNMAGAYAPVAVALNSSALYAGQAIGSVLGGLLWSTGSMVLLPWAAAAAVAAALLVSVSIKQA